MIRLTFCIHRQAHLNLAEFQAYWLNRHGPLVKRLAPALNIRRYVQIHAADHPLNGAIQKSRRSGAAFDGVAELWFDSIESMTAPGSNPEGKAANRTLREDEARFIDAARSSIWFGEEHRILGD